MRQLKAGCSYPMLHHHFVSLLDNTGLTQLVEDATRGANMLDLFCTNMSAKFNKVEVIPAVSHHCVVAAEIYIKPIQESRLASDGNRDG